MQANPLKSTVMAGAKTASVCVETTVASNAMLSAYAAENSMKADRIPATIFFISDSSCMYLAASYVRSASLRARGKNHRLRLPGSCSGRPQRIDGIEPAGLCGAGRQFFAARGGV